MGGRLKSGLENLKFAVAGLKKRERSIHFRHALPYLPPRGSELWYIHEWHEDISPMASTSARNATPDRDRTKLRRGKSWVTKQRKPAKHSNQRTKLDREKWK